MSVKDKKELNRIIEKETDNDLIVKKFRKFIRRKPVLAYPKEYQIVIHPIFSSTITGYMKEDHSIEYLNIMEKEYFDKAIIQYDSITNISRMFSVIRTPWLLTFLKLIEENIDLKTFSTYLKSSYTRKEFPSWEAFIDNKTDELINMFKKASPEFLMDEEEYKKFLELPEEITVYRGYQSSLYYNAIGWTLKYNMALWFANRFKKDGLTPTVYSAKINKKHIFAYYSLEDEIVLNPKFLQNIVKINADQQQEEKKI